MSSRQWVVILPGRRMLLLLLFILLIIGNVAKISALVSCEGFVKSNSIPIDYATIQTKLFTAQGNLKHESECNPQNGYFFLPIYNKGRYLVRVSAPEGWIFQPESHEVEIADEGGCPQELNFELVGFQIKGAVLESLDSPLHLGLYHENGELVGRTSTDSNGKYSFIAKPGKYLISPISGSTHCVDHGSLRVEVATSPVEVKPDIRIAGHSLKLQINDDQGQPLTDATALLVSEKQIKFQNLPIGAQVPLARSSGENGRWIYSLGTDSSGSVLFNCVPTGKYSLSASLARPNMEVHFEEKPVEMGSKAVELVISIRAFTFSGRVVAGKSRPVQGARVSLDGVQAGESDADGVFKLPEVPPGRHGISAEREHFAFDQLQIEGSSKRQAEIVLRAKRMAFCGKVVSSEKKLPPSLSFQLIRGEDGSVVDEFQPDEQRQFCRMAEPGKYLLQPASPSIALSPKQIAIDLTEGPSLDSRFIQFKARLEGRVSCFGTCKMVQVGLWQGADAQEEEEELVARREVGGDGQFVFEGIAPGKYKMKVTDGQNIWWEERELALEVLDTDLARLAFVQRGYGLALLSTHPARLKYWPKKAKKPRQVEKTVELVEGANSLRFEEADQFAFSIESCHHFRVDLPEGEGEEEGTFTVPSPAPIALTAVSSSVSVTVQMDGQEGKDPSLQLILRDGREELLAQEELPSKAGRAFSFRLDNRSIGRQFLVVPKSERLLFSPESSSFTFDGKCNSELASFKAKVGRFIEGRVQPVVPGASVRATHRRQPEVQFNGETDESGKYRLGPVWEVDDFTVEMSKEGFEFSPSEGNAHNFGSIRHSQLLIRFLDNHSKAPLPDVLVSISGGAEFRSKNMTGTTGLLNFIGLAPGSYYVRPILQEYKFNSSSFAVQITEGETQELVLEARRYAFSVFGRVSTIGSRPYRVPIRVEAIAEQCEKHQEEALLDPKTDEFRIRGLMPECEYKVVLRNADNQRAVEAFPPLINIMTGAEDKRNVNFVILPVEQPNPVVACELVLTQERAATISGFRAVLLEAGNVLQEQLVQGPASVFFFTLGQYDREYTVRVDRIETKQHKIEPMSVNFVANSQFKHIRLVAKPAQRTSDVEILKANYIGLALILLITFVFLNPSKAKLVADYLLNKIRDYYNRTQANAGTAAAAEDPLKRKKAKKT